MGLNPADILTRMLWSSSSEEDQSILVETSDRFSAHFPSGIEQPFVVQVAMCIAEMQVKRNYLPQ